MVKKKGENVKDSDKQEKYEDNENKDFNNVNNDNIDNNNEDNDNKDNYNDDNVKELPSLVKKRRGDKGIVQKRGEGKVQRTTTMKTMKTNLTTSKTITMTTTTMNFNCWSRRGDKGFVQKRGEKRGRCKGLMDLQRGDILRMQ